MRRSNFTIALYLALVFASGIMVGVLAYRFVAVTPVVAKAPVKPTPEEWRKQYLREMQARLKLTPDQMGQLNAIQDETRARFHEARDRHDKQMKTVREEQTEKVRAMLTPEQRPEYEKLRAEREARAKPTH